MPRIAAQRSATLRSTEALLALAAVAVSACSAAVSPGATPGPAVFTLHSSAFAAAGAIPSRFSCDGPDVSPPLRWEGTPPGTRAFALLVTDPDARGFVHWALTDLPSTVDALPEDASGHLEGVEGRNDFGRTGWGGPCPPSGTHRYVFELYALSAPLGLRPGFGAQQLRAAVGGRSLGVARLTGTYRRG